MARESKSVDLVAGRRADDECRPGNQLAEVKGRKNDRNISKAAPSPGRCSHVKRSISSYSKVRRNTNVRNSSLDAAVFYGPRESWTSWGGEAVRCHISANESAEQNRGLVKSTVAILRSMLRDLSRCKTLDER